MIRMMRTLTTAALPPSQVLDAFGLTGPLVPLSGGQRTTWRVGDAVLKRLDTDPSVIQWQSMVLSRLTGRDDFRVSSPLQTVDGRWSAHGWTAWQYQPGEHVAERWHDIIDVGQRLHRSLTTVPEPEFLRRRTDRWSVGDKVAWGDISANKFADINHLSTLAAALRPVNNHRQLIHGDLTSNVLFHDALPPLVIDLSVYWRPPSFASAIVIADALAFEGADEDIVEPLRKTPDFAQYLLRALIYRIVADHFAGTQQQRPSANDPYRFAVELATQLDQDER